ncbi:MAG: HAD-IC family P-type ATPase [Propionibacteriaceae bacterium]|nr:HAD-IC family P-type ATPase [Propionibacteriaceae bacterium]
MTTLTNPGLSSGEVAERVAKGLVNSVPPRSGRTTWDIVRANVFTRINFLLMVLFALTISTGSWANALFGVLVVFNAGVGMVEELRAKRTLDNLAVVGEGRPKVRRDGQVVQLAREGIVLDDVIEVGPGDQIVVDGRLVEASHLELDESLLTGESDPVEKSPGQEVMSGSHVVAGAGAFRATRIGADSYANKLTAQANRFALTKSELQGGINVILRIITWLLIPVGLATVWVQWTRGGTWQQIILRMVGALVPMVPEGLVFLTSLAFAAAVIRLGRKSVLVQELPAVEGLAKVDVVCADKTGTLTENGLRFGELIALDGADEASARAVLAQFAAADIAPNASMLSIKDALPLDGPPWEAVALAPFSSARQWSGVSFAGQGSVAGAEADAPRGGWSNWCLGAPDVLAPAQSQAARRAERIGATGRRVLLLARAELRVDDDAAPGPVQPVALVVLEQRVRPEARQTLAYFASQQVAVKVISGDNAASVGAVLESLGVEAGEVVDARELPDDPNAFADAVDSHSVFGRVTPEQKRLMVAALQARGHNVAMTGDGVNDVLAIKDADLGVAMGSGAEATRAVAQVVLLDDSFATLPSVVAEGRRVLGNIERVANFFLTKTMYSILLALLVVVARIKYPFMPIHASVVGWFTIGIPAFILAMAPNTERARPGFLRRVLNFGIPAGVVVGAVVFASYQLVRAGAGDPVGDLQASSAALVTLLMGAAWVMVVNSRPYRWWKIAMIVGCVGLCCLVYAVPMVLPTCPVLCSGDCLGVGYLFMIDPTNPTMMWTGVWMGALCAGLIEALWWIVGRATGEPRRIWDAA